jgi:hypothetical protein
VFDRIRVERLGDLPRFGEILCNMRHGAGR